MSKGFMNTMPGFRIQLLPPAGWGGLRFPSPSVAQCVGSRQANISGILPEAYSKALEGWTLQGEGMHAALENFL